MELSTPLMELPGVGPRLVASLRKLGLFTVEDLLHHYPSRYVDYSQTVSVVEASLGKNVTLRGSIWQIKNIYTKYGKKITRALFNDGTSSIELVWFNSPWLVNQVKTGDELQISGKLKKKGSTLSITMPVWEKIGQSIGRSVGVHTGKMVAVYPETYGLTSKFLREKVAAVLEECSLKIGDPLPEKLRADMVTLPQALKEIHSPTNLEFLSKAQERLGFEELLLIQLATVKARRDWQTNQGSAAIKVDRKDLEKFREILPFELTRAQKRVIEEILPDLASPKPLNRLIQGDVGSGKTVVAAAAAFVVAKAGYKTLFMAPTETLAVQHFQTLEKIFAPLGIQVALLTGNQSVNTENMDNISIISGTHALISDKFSVSNVALSIVDEQHKFGVLQRQKLRERERALNFLSLTATPIPRTVALMMYGDLDISVIGEMPKDRKKVQTFVVPNTKREDAYKFIRKHIKKGEQAFVVTPLIDESDSLEEVKAAKKEFEKLSKSIFPDLKLGLLHGKLGTQERLKVMKGFREGAIDILVATPVVEVGIDISNATIIVIEGAERFGLASLHQLRGRVGRGVKESYCLLFCSGDSPNNNSRLQKLVETHSGLELAEYDLKLRGSGEIYGINQAGRFKLKIASMFDLELIAKARATALKMLDEDLTLDKNPTYKIKLSSLIKSSVAD